MVTWWNEPEGAVAHLGQFGDAVAAVVVRAERGTGVRLASLGDLGL
jgi:hypothetical protein